MNKEELQKGYYICKPPKKKEEKCPKCGMLVSSEYHKKHPCVLD